MWGVRPSDLLDVKDRFDAFCLDDAVAWLGSHLENELSKVEGKNPEQTAVMRQRLLSKLLQGKEGYADPVAMGVAIKSVNG